MAKPIVSVGGQHTDIGTRSRDSRETTDITIYFTISEIELSQRKISGERK